MLGCVLWPPGEARARGSVEPGDDEHRDRDERRDDHHDSVHEKRECEPRRPRRCALLSRGRVRLLPSDRVGERARDELVEAHSLALGSPSEGAVQGLGHAQQKAPAVSSLGLRARSGDGALQRPRPSRGHAWDCRSCLPAESSRRSSQASFNSARSFSRPFLIRRETWICERPTRSAIWACGSSA